MLEDVEANQERLQKWSGKKIQEVLLKAMAGKLKWWEAGRVRSGYRWRIWSGCCGCTGRALSG